MRFILSALVVAGLTFLLYTAIALSFPPFPLLMLAIALLCSVSMCALSA